MRTYTKLDGTIYVPLDEVLRLLDNGVVLAQEMKRNTLHKWESLPNPTGSDFAEAAYLSGKYDTYKREAQHRQQTIDTLKEKAT